MSVLARNRSLSKLEFYMNAVKLRRQLIFLMGRDFGVKPRIREPRFCTKKWEPQDAIRQLETIFRDKELTNLAKKILKTYEVDISYTDSDLMDEVFNSLEYVKIPKERLTGDRMMQKSLGIGAPISQIIGILYPTLIDQYVKTVKAVHGYDAYMDDRIVLHHDKAFLRALLRDIETLAKRLGIHINQKKTQIVKLSHGFTWLKTRYILTPTGKIIKKIPKDVTKRERRKLKKLAQKVAAGDMTAEDYEN